MHKASVTGCVRVPDLASCESAGRAARRQADRCGLLLTGHSPDCCLRVKARVSATAPDAPAPDEERAPRLARSPSRECGRAGWPRRTVGPFVDRATAHVKPTRDILCAMVATSQSAHMHGLDLLPHSSSPGLKRHDASLGGDALSARAQSPDACDRRTAMAPAGRDIPASVSLGAPATITTSQWRLNA